MLSYFVYFEIKHQKWSVCVSLLSTYMCVNLAEKVPLVIEISAKQHRGHFYWTPCRRHPRSVIAYSAQVVHRVALMRYYTIVVPAVHGFHG